MSTWQSSPPEANVPLRNGDHSTELTAPPWPRSSRRAWPGCRTSSIRIMLLSCANVASKCVSCGEVARRSRGGGWDIVC